MLKKKKQKSKSVYQEGEKGKNRTKTHTKNLEHQDTESSALPLTQEENIPGSDHLITPGGKLARLYNISFLFVFVVLKLVWERLSRLVLTAFRF